jgi:2',3'-cyclic-nucleotide 2'-phosphodiesterase (5'-nucleotidase family)
MKRRTFLQGTTLGALAGRLPAAEAKAVTVTILHTNDVHGHLLPWQG